MNVTPMSLPSLPSLRFEAVKPLNMHGSLLSQLRSKEVSSEHYNSLPAFCKRSYGRRDNVMSPPRHSFVSPLPEPELAWRSMLTVDQVAAIAIARQETGYAPLGSKSKLVWPSKHTDTIVTTTENWKKTRRKEQCRINQANYRKRKRQHEQEVAGEIKVLEQELTRLETHRVSGSHGGQTSAIESIGDFYYVAGVESEQPRLDMGTFRLADGSSPALQCLLDLQREEFESVESLMLHWLCYRKQFRIFQLSVNSCERLEAGDHVIIRITGQLQLDVYYNTQKQDGDNRGHGAITCPITQQFEFETGCQVITRITSEVDLVGGVAAAQVESAPENTLSVLRCLSEGFTLSNCNHIM
ncbi:unnamed protein product [Peronospora farinosa]|uniref:BZIP domain-containing protein n=1 Tax=Peronospora farinosa TaxID=134698 RepID=A0ABN8CG39_9STRA|nr:unnamed protein product [Peronospora farinosa]